MEHRGNPLPDHVVSQLRQMRRRGASLRSIADASGVAKSTVEKYCGGPSYPVDPPAVVPRLVHPELPDEVADDEPEGPGDEDLVGVEGDCDSLLDEYLTDDR